MVFFIYFFLHLRVCFSSSCVLQERCKKALAFADDILDLQEKNRLVRRSYICLSPFPIMYT
jgi:hypothetical protein